MNPKLTTFQKLKTLAKFPGAVLKANAVKARLAAFHEAERLDRIRNPEKYRGK